MVSLGSQQQSEEAVTRVCFVQELLLGFVHLSLLILLITENVALKISYKMKQKHLDYSLVPAAQTTRFCQMDVDQIDASKQFS